MGKKVFDDQGSTLEVSTNLSRGTRGSEGNGQKNKYDGTVEFGDDGQGFRKHFERGGRGRGFDRDGRGRGGNWRGDSDRGRVGWRGDFERGRGGWRGNSDRGREYRRGPSDRGRGGWRGESDSTREWRGSGRGRGDGGRNTRYWQNEEEDDAKEVKNETIDDNEEVYRKKKSWKDEGNDEEEVKTFPLRKKNPQWENIKLRHWRIIVRNLPFKTTKQDLEKLCVPHGEFTEVVLPKCKDARFPDSCAGFGFVQYKEKEDAEKALKVINGASVHGRKVAADWTMPKDTYETAKHDEEEELKKKVKVEKESDEEDDDEEEEEDVEKKMEKMEVDDEDDEENSDEDEEEEEEDSEDDDDEDEEKTEDKDIEQKKKRPAKQDEAVSEGRAVFLRNLSFSTTDNSLKEAMKKFGNVKLAIVCKFADAGHSKGTAFVHFATKEEADSVVDSAMMGELSIDGRTINANIALPREEAHKLDKERLKKAPTDKRNLMLARMGIIREGTTAANGMSKNDANKRIALVESAKKKLENLHMFISPLRIVVHNVPFSFTDQKLKTICREAAGPTSTVTECRIWRDKDRLDSKGIAKSRGFAFIAFSTHKDALTCLQKLNNNTTTFTNDRRPIIEFSIENLKALKLKESRVVKSAGAKKNLEEKRNDPQVQKEVERTTSKLRKAGVKPIPLRLGAKKRHNDRSAGGPPKKKKKKKDDKKKTTQKEDKPGGAQKRPGKAAKRTLSKFLSHG